MYPIKRYPQVGMYMDNLEMCNCNSLFSCVNSRGTASAVEWSDHVGALQSFLYHGHMGVNFNVKDV